MTVAPALQQPPVRYEEWLGSQSEAAKAKMTVRKAPAVKRPPENLERWYQQHGVEDWRKLTIDDHNRMVRETVALMLDEATLGGHHIDGVQRSASDSNSVSKTVSPRGQSSSLPSGSADAIIFAHEAGDENGADSNDQHHVGATSHDDCSAEVQKDKEEDVHDSNDSQDEEEGF